MTTTRIYLLDTINQSDIIGTRVVPTEDPAGVDTNKVTFDQLAKYLFNGASTTDDSGPLSGYPLVIGNNSNVNESGSNVTVFGESNIARNDDGGPVNYATVIGYNNQVMGNWGASAVGYRNNANYSQSSAFGHKNTASDRHASAFGTDNLASGQGSTAIGRNNTASGYGATACGYDNTASNDYTTACGYNNSVYGDYGQAFGYRNSIGDGPFPGKKCVAIGIENSASGNYGDNDGRSVAVGYDNGAYGYRCSSIGVDNFVGTMGNVTEGSAVGYQNTASGYWGSSAFGYRNNAYNSRTTAFGHKNTANEDAASAIGNYNTASGYGSTACGYDNISSSAYASALGYNNTASGNNSSAIGYNNTSSGSWGTSAVGHDNTASTNQASAFGHNNTASGHSSSAFGFGCSAYGANSSAFGLNAITRPIGVTNIGGAIVTRADNSENYNATDMLSNYAGVQNIVMTATLDMTKATYSITTVAQDGNGAGYQVGDTMNVNGGNGDAIITVASVDGGGAPTGYTITNAGSGYSTGTNIATTIISSGDGDGNATVNISVALPIQLNIPSGCLFYPDEIGIITTGTVNSVTAQPNVAFGWNGTLNGLLASTPTTNLTQVGSREIFTSLLTYDGKQTLTFSVSVAAAATTLAARAYFKGILIENTPIG